MFLPSTLLTFLSSLLFTAPTPPSPPPPSSNGLQFTLRQYHAVTQDARVLFHDLPSAASVVSESLSEPLRTRRVPLHRPRIPDYWRDPNAHAASKQNRGDNDLGDGFNFNGGGDWEEDEVDAPDVERRETLLALAKMTNNAYMEPGEAGWYDLGGTWNVVSVSIRSVSLVRAEEGIGRMGSIPEAEATIAVDGPVHTQTRECYHNFFQICLSELNIR